MVYGFATRLKEDTMRENITKILTRLKTLTLTEILLLLTTLFLFLNWQKQLDLNAKLNDIYDSVETMRTNVSDINDNVDSIQTDVDSIQSDVSDIRANQP